MEPLWWILIIYAFVVLTVIYTYQFSYVRELWIELFKSSHGDLTVDEMCVYMSVCMHVCVCVCVCACAHVCACVCMCARAHVCVCVHVCMYIRMYICIYVLRCDAVCSSRLESIGFFVVYIDTLSFKTFKDLFETIVPTAVFVAVMALQLKYFTPPNSREDDRMYQLRQSDQAKCNSFIEKVNQSSELERSPEDQPPNDTTGASPDEDTTDKHAQEVIKKYWTRFKIILRFSNEFLWRLLEIYLPKVIIFVIFAVILDDLSASHFLVLAILVVTIPIDINPVMYLILTGVISNLTLLKMLYQVALVDEKSFEFSHSCPVRNHNTVAFILCLIMFFVYRMIPVIYHHQKEVFITTIMNATILHG